MVRWGEVSLWVDGHSAACRTIWSAAALTESDLAQIFSLWLLLVVLALFFLLLLLFCCSCCCCSFKAKWKFFHCDVVREKYKGRTMTRFQRGREGWGKGERASKLTACAIKFCVPFCIKIVSTVLFCLFCFTISIPHTERARAITCRREMDREKQVTERATRNGAAKPYRFNNFDNFKLLGFKVQKVLQ